MQILYMKRSNWSVDAIIINEEIQLVGKCKYYTWKDLIG